MHTATTPMPPSLLGNMLTPADATSRSTMNILHAGALLGLEQQAIENFVNPQSIHIFRLNVTLFGKPFSVWGCTSFHNRARGIYKGGIRISADVNVEETIELSRLMTLKTALAELEMGGGKTGIKLDMRAIYALFGKTGFDREFEKQVKRAVMSDYAHQYRGMLEKRRYVPAPDLGTGPDEMVCIYNETHEPSSVTGKPEGVCGWLPGRAEATGYGVFTIIMGLLKKLGKRPDEASVAIQGFGNVGSNAAQFLYQRGVRICGVVDVRGGAYAAQGLDIPQLMAYAREHGSVAEFGEALSTEAFYALPVDVCVPAAINDAITPALAETIQAQYVVEGANFPTQYAALQQLEARGIRVIPDILANAGGVIASAEEFVHAVSTTKIKPETVYGIIDEKIHTNLRRAEEIAEERGITLDLGCTLIAMQRVVQTMRLHGWV
jgi:glutamate dehydrogenase/leucine dehydrogenase